jgi:phage tail sheath protein FI
MKAFEDIDDVNIMAVPGVTDVNIQQALLAHCENLQSRFAVLDIPQDAQAVSDVKTHRNNFVSSFVAVYHPWVSVFDQVDNKNIFIPPSGSVMGIYSRSDNDRGVFKAPANEVVLNASDVKYIIGKGEQDVLNPAGVNCIRAFTGRGIRVWGQEHALMIPYGST